MQEKVTINGTSYYVGLSDVVLLQMQSGQKAIDYAVLDQEGT